MAKTIKLTKTDSIEIDLEKKFVVIQQGNSIVGVLDTKIVPQEIIETYTQYYFNLGYSVKSTNEAPEPKPQFISRAWDPMPPFTIGGPEKSPQTPRPSKFQPPDVWGSGAKDNLFWNSPLLGSDSSFPNQNDHIKGELNGNIRS